MLRRLTLVVLVFLWAALLAVAAHAETIVLSNTSTGCTVGRATPLNGVNGVFAGEWFAMEGFDHFTVHVSGITTATVNVRGSNRPTKPPSSNNEILLQSLSSNAVVDIALPVRWLKVDVSSYSEGQVYAWVEGLVCK